MAAPQLAQCLAAGVPALAARACPAALLAGGALFAPRWRAQLQRRPFSASSAPAFSSSTGPASLQQHAMRPSTMAAAGPLLFMKPATPAWRAVLVDAAGTLLVPRERTADVYLRYASKYGVSLSEQEVLERFRSAYNTPWGQSQLRYVGDGRPFWRFIVEASTGCDSPELFEEVYRYYVMPEAWTLAPGAVAALSRLRAAGVRLAVVSNFDTRLRPILSALGVSGLFDAIVVSAEVGAEKPNPVIFEAALSSLGLRPGEAVHVGDDRRNDVWGARDAGITAWLWGVDVRSFDEVARRVLRGPLHCDDDSSDDEDEDAAQQQQQQQPGAAAAAAPTPSQP